MQNITGFSLEAFALGNKEEVIYQPAADVRLPLLICRGANRGRRLVAVAGVHGDEYEGMQAVWKTFRALNPATMCGDFIGLPIAHVAAYEAFVRESPLDGKNLARSFPGRVDGTITEQLAYFLFEQIVSKADFLLDFHSGGKKYNFLPLVGYYEMNNQASAISLDLANRLKLPYRWKLPHTAGVLTYEACQRNIPSIGTEYLGEGKLSPEGVAAYIDCIGRCLDYLEISSGQNSDPFAQTVIIGDWMTASHVGLFIGEVKTGEHVARGVRLGRVEALSGEVLEDFIAAHDGVILGVRSVAPIMPGDWAVAVVEEAPRA